MRCFILRWFAARDSAKEAGRIRVGDVDSAEQPRAYQATRVTCPAPVVDGHLAFYFGGPVVADGTLLL